MQQRSLEQKVISVIAVAGFLGSFVFFQSAFTGNVIAGLSNKVTSWLSGVLFFVGVIAGFSWVKNRQKI